MSTPYITPLGNKALSFDPSDMTSPPACAKFTPSVTCTRSVGSSSPLMVARKEHSTPAVPVVFRAAPLAAGVLLGCLAFPQCARAQQTALFLDVAPVELTNLRLMPSPRDRGRWVHLPLPEGLLSAHTDGPIVRYGYDEQCLITGRRANEETCYLDIYVVPREPASEQAWWERWDLSVSGTFVDQIVELSGTIYNGWTTNRAILAIKVHQHDPKNALVLEPSDLTIAPSDPTTLTLRLINKTPFSINISKDDVKVRGIGGALGTPEPQPGTGGPATQQTVEVVQIPPVVASHGSKALVVRVTPRSWPAFWTSLRPYQSTAPHGWLHVDIPFEVQGGGRGCIQAQLPVKYSVNWPLRLMSVAIGSLLACILWLFFGNGDRQDGARFGLLGGTVVVSIVFYLLYVVGKGDRQVVLFDYSLDPSQLVPSFLIGFLLGANAPWYGRLASSGRGGVAALLLAFTSLLAISACRPAVAQTGSFRPVSLAIDPHSGAVLVLSSPENVLYEVVNDRLKPLAQLERRGVATDLCVGGENSRTWFVVSLVMSVSGIVDRWRSAFLFGSVEELRTKGRWTRARDNWGLYAGLACTSDNRLLALDGHYATVRSFLVTGGRDLQEVRSQMAKYSPPSSIAVDDGTVFLGSTRARNVAMFDSRREHLQKLRNLAEIDDPRDMSVTPDRRALLIADAATRRILRCDLRSYEVDVLLEGSELRTPVDVIQAAQNTLWIADPGARAVFRARDGTLTRIDAR